MTWFCLVLLVAFACNAAGPTPAPTSLAKVFGTVGPSSTISLKDQSGQIVTTLKPGKYTFVIIDRSGSDNFHLVGPTVNLKTPVKLTTKSGWVVTIKAGTYRFYSDKHPQTLTGSFKVT